MPPDETTWYPDPHTLAKQRLYYRYFQAWFAVVQQGFTCGATYAEGFAGPGEYKDGSPGSPLQAVEAALRCVEPPSVERPVGFVFIDERADRITHLNGLLHARLDTLDPRQLAKRGIHLDARPGTCEPLLQERLSSRHAWGKPMLVVLDTWGSAVSFQLLHQLASHRFSEVIVTIQPQQFVRFARDPEHYGDRVFGPTVWRDVQSVNSADKATYIKNQYRRTVRDAGFRHVFDFELADERSNALYLVYGTNHIKGVQKFKYAMWDLDPYRGVGYRDPHDPDQEMLAIQPRPQTGPLRRQLLGYLRQQGSRPVTVRELKDFALEYTLYRETHVIPVIRSLLHEGSLVRLDNGNGVTNKTTIQAKPRTA